MNLFVTDPEDFIRRNICYLSGGGGSQKVVQSSAPWKGQEPFLKDLYGDAQTAFNATPKTAYGGAILAPVSPQQQAALALIEGQAPQYANLGQGALTLGQKLLSGDYLSPESNPYLQGAMDAAINPIQRRYQNEVLPGVMSQAITSGAYGGDRDALITAEAARGFAQEGLDTTSKMQYQNYSDMFNRMMQAPALLEQGVGLNQIQPNMLAQVGDTRRAWEQEQLDAALQKYNMNLAAPWNGLQQYSNVIQGMDPGGTMTQSGGGASALTRAAQGALGGASLGGSLASLMGVQSLGGIGSTIAGMGSMTPFLPWLGGGALIGGLLGAL